MNLLATPPAPLSSKNPTAVAHEFGMTQQARTLFSIFERQLPTEFLALLCQPDVVLLALFDASKEQVLCLQGFRSFPFANATWVQVETDWAFYHKLWFRARPNAASDASGCAKYETFLSYLEDYRPEFQVDLSFPLFSLTVG